MCGAPRDCDEYLRTAAYACNNTPHSGTGFSPMGTLFGFVSDIPNSLKRAHEPVYNNQLYYRQLFRRVQIAYKDVKENLLHAKGMLKK